MEMILIVVLSVALGVLSTVFYFMCLRDKPVQISFPKKEEDICVPKVRSDEYHLTQISGDNSTQVQICDINTQTTKTSKLHDRLAQIKEFSMIHKAKIGFCILFIIACVAGAWLGHTLMMNVNDIIKENKKANSLGMIMIEPDCIKVKHIDEGSDVLYL